MDSEWHSNPVRIIGKLGSSIKFICKKDQSFLILDSILGHLIYYDSKLSHHVILFFLNESLLPSLFHNIAMSFYSQDLDYCLAHGRHLKLLRNECKCSCPGIIIVHLKPMCVTDCIIGPSSSPWHFIHASAVLPTTNRVYFLTS